MILGERRLREPMFCPSWEGDRVICIESGMKNDDLPEGVISQECRDFVSDSEEEEVVLTFVQWAKETFETSLFQRYFLKDIFYGLESGWERSLQSSQKSRETRSSKGRQSHLRLHKEDDRCT